MTTPVWVERPTPKEKGVWKSDRNGSRYRIGGEGGGRDTIQNIGVDLQLQVMEIFRQLMTGAHFENLLCPMAVDDR